MRIHPLNRNKNLFIHNIDRIVVCLEREASVQGHGYFIPFQDDPNASNTISVYASFQDYSPITLKEVEQMFKLKDKTQPTTQEETNSSSSDTSLNVSTQLQEAIASMQLKEKTLADTFVNDVNVQKSKLQRYREERIKEQEKTDNNKIVISPVNESSSTKQPISTSSVSNNCALTKETMYELLLRMQSSQEKLMDLFVKIIS